MDGHGGLVRTLVLASFGFIHRFLLTTSESNEEIKILVLYFTKLKKKKKKPISSEHLDVVEIFLMVRLAFFCESCALFTGPTSH